MHLQIKVDGKKIPEHQSLKFMAMLQIFNWFQSTELMAKCSSYQFKELETVTWRWVSLYISIKCKPLLNSTSNLANTDIKLKFTPKIIEKNGKQYLQADKFKLSFDTRRLYMSFENLFNGDKALGDNMNLFLNDNWQDILKELKPSITEALSQIFAALINAVFNKVPYNEIWIDSE